MEKSFDYSEIFDYPETFEEKIDIAIQLIQMQIERQINESYRFFRMMETYNTTGMLIYDQYSTT